MNARKLAHIPISFWLGATVVVGALLRLLDLGHKSYWWDEVATITICRLPVSSFWSLLWKAEANMVFYYLLVRPWIHFGDGERWLRLLSVIPAVASIPVIYVLGSRIGGKRTGLAAALLLSLNVAHIAYAQEARSYSLLMLLCLLSLLFFLRLMNGGTGTVLLYVVTSVLAVYTHFFAVFLLFSEWVSLLILRVRDLPWKRYLAAIALTTCLVSPALYYMVYHRGSQLAFIPRPHLHDITELIYFLTADIGKFRKALAVLYLICSAVAVHLLFLRGRREDNPVQRLGVAASVACTALPIAITFVISFWVPIFFPRYLLICLPPLVLLAARGLVELRPVWLRAAAIILLVGVTIGCLKWYYPHPKDDWRSLSAYVLTHSQPGDTIVGCPAGAEWPVQYYGAAMGAGAPRFSYLTSVALLQQIHGAEAHPSRFWLVSWGDNPDATAIVQGITPEYARVDEQHFPGFLTLALYSGSHEEIALAGAPAKPVGLPHSPPSGNARNEASVHGRRRAESPHQLNN